MSTRTTGKTVTFAHPFLLKGVDRTLPPGDYRVVTDEELIEEIILSSLPAHVHYDSRCRHNLTSGRDGDG